MNGHRMHEKRRSQGGQAIAELAVCIIGMLICLLGYFLVSAITFENVKNTIQSRAIADKSVRNGESGVSGSTHNIAEWDYGYREIPFTADDTVIPSGMIDGAEFSASLSADRVNLVSLRGGNYLPSAYNAAYGLSLIHIFSNAANLVEGTSTESDPLGKRGLNSLKNSFKSMFGVRSFFLSDHTYMPAAPAIPDPQNATGL